MSNLEDLRNEILEFSKGKFHIFRTFDLLGGAKLTIQWQGDNISEFLSICQSLNIDILYFFEGQMADDYPEHGSEIAMIQLGFFHNGILHTIVKEADWFVASATDQTPVEENTVASQSLDELVSEMVAFIQEQYKDLPDEEYRLVPCPD